MDEGGINTIFGIMAHEGLRPSGWGKGEFPVKTWPPLNLLFLVLRNLDSCKQEGGVRLGS